MTKREYKQRIKKSEKRKETAMNVTSFDVNKPGFSATSKKRKWTTPQKRSEDLACKNRFSSLSIEEGFEDENPEALIESFKKSKKRKAPKRKQKSVETKQTHSKFESSEYKFPQVSRCAKCFLNHFPNSKFCRSRFPKEQTSEKTHEQKMWTLC